MSFVYPAFLSAFALLAIPIIIHLFNFKKYQRLLFPNLAFLKEVQEKTKKQSQLKHLLVLLCRLIVISFIVLAFAQPFSGSIQSASPNKVVSIYIDNSFSMEGLGKNGTLIDLAKQKAADLINSSNQSTRFQILTNEFSQVSQRLHNKEEALELVESISIFPNSRNVNEVISRQDELIKTTNADNIQLIHISDFQKTHSTYAKSSTHYNLSLIPLKAQSQSNISIDSVWFNNPLHAKNGTEDFYFRVHNYNTEKTETVTLQLFLNNRQKSVATITVPASTSVDSSFTFTNTETGIVHGKLSLSDKQIVFDDHLFFTYTIEPFLKVACINDFISASDTNSYDLKNIFTNDPYYAFKSYTKQNIDFTQLKQKQFIILNKLPEITSGLAQELELFVSNGGNICIIPSLKSNTASYNNLLSSLGCVSLGSIDTSKTLADKPDFNDPFYSGIFEKQPNQLDLPIIRKHFNVGSSTKSLSNTILRLKNGMDLISGTKYKKGKVYLFTSPTTPDCGNLGQHALFVPILLRMAELSTSTGSIYQVFGKNAGFDVKQVALSGDQVFSLQLNNTKENSIPEFKNDGNSISIFFSENIKTAGNYNLLLSDKTIAGTSLNYPREESVMSYYSNAELETLLQSNGYTNYKIYDKPVDDSKLEMGTIDNTKKYWTSCIWIALLFLLAESAILKFWNT